MKNWWNNFRYNFAVKMQRFMAGRYGNDQLNRFLAICVWVFIILYIFFRNPWIYFWELLLLGIMTFRTFSRNFVARRKENDKYLALTARIRKWFNLQKKKWNDRKDYRYRSCPACRQTLRIRNVKGAHTIRCPKCGKEFQTRIM